MLAVGVGDIHAADTIAIGIEGDAAAIWRWPHVKVVGGVVHNPRDFQHRAITVGISAHQRRSARLFRVVEHGGPCRSERR
jgi:hypothetical protein